MKNKAGYMATVVTCRWVGAIFEVTRPFWGQGNKIIKKGKRVSDQPTDQKTDQPTDRWIDVLLLAVLGTFLCNKFVAVFRDQAAAKKGSTEEENDAHSGKKLQ